MAVTVKQVKEINYYLEKRKQAVEALTSEAWSPLAIINLKIAFRRGYDAKYSYNDKKK